MKDAAFWGLPDQTPSNTQPYLESHLRVRPTKTSRFPADDRKPALIGLQEPQSISEQDNPLRPDARPNTTRDSRWTAPG